MDMEPLPIDPLQQVKKLIVVVNIRRHLLIVYILLFLCILVPFYLFSENIMYVIFIVFFYKLQDLSSYDCYNDFQSGKSLSGGCRDLN